MNFLMDGVLIRILIDVTKCNKLLLLHLIEDCEEKIIQTPLSNARIINQKLKLLNLN